MKRFVLMALTVLVAWMSVADPCAAITQKGTRCTRKATDGHGYCKQHAIGSVTSPPDGAGAKARAGADFPAMNMQLITESRRVLAVTNGVYLILDGSQKARLAGVTAGDSVSAYVRAFCGTNCLTMEYDHAESGYQYATVYIRKDGRCLNEELIRSGLGGVSNGAVFRYRAEFETAQAEARTAKRGLWADPM